MAEGTAWSSVFYFIQKKGRIDNEYELRYNEENISNQISRKKKRNEHNTTKEEQRLYKCNLYIYCSSDADKCITGVRTLFLHFSVARR